MNESPLSTLDPAQLKELVDFHESGGFQLLLKILEADLARATEGLKIIGDPNFDPQRLAHWRGQAHTTQFLQNLPAVVEFETKRRDDLETAMMNQGEVFHNPHPSILNTRTQFGTEHITKNFPPNLQNPFMVK